MAPVIRFCGRALKQNEDESREARRFAEEPPWQRLLTEAVAFETADKARALGETLPVWSRLEQKKNLGLSDESEGSDSSNGLLYLFPQLRGIISRRLTRRAGAKIRHRPVFLWKRPGELLDRS